MTSGPAKVLGLTDRGVLSLGMKADVNVDADQVTELQPTLVHDFPNGARVYSEVTWLQGDHCKRSGQRSRQ